MGTELVDVRELSKLSGMLESARSIVTKNYLCKLEQYELAELPPELRELNIADYTRLYKFTELISDQKENVLERLITVLNAAHASSASVLTFIRGCEDHTEYYLGIVNKNVNEDTASKGAGFEGTLRGNFPGLKEKSLRIGEIEKVLGLIQEASYITSVSGLASLRNKEQKDYEKFVQGIEHLTDSLRGRSYGLLILADPVNMPELERAKQGYENLYSQLSPFASTTLNFNSSDSLTFSKTNTENFSKTVGDSIADTQNYSRSNGWSESKGWSDSHTRNMGAGLGAAGSAATGMGATAAGGALAFSLAVPPAAPVLIGAGIALAAVGGLMGSDTVGHSETHTTNFNATESRGYTRTSNQSDTVQRGKSSGESEGSTRGRSYQFNSENKAVKDLMNVIEKNIERLQRCEALGAFQCAAYVLSSNPETNAMVANGYNALMRGEDSSLQSSYINQWRAESPEGRKCRSYLEKLSHPLMMRRGENILVNPAILSTSSEMAINIGFPKKSLSGLPVIEMASFGRNVFTREQAETDAEQLHLGAVYHMGAVEKTPVELDMRSLSMHSFITGSTGAGKSNTVYQILQGLCGAGIPFLVVEPAKGEYKQVFGNRKDVQVYGTNPYLSPLLRINPFRFPKGIHVLEHADRLIEIFNVCFPMYAAMPAVLKDAVLRAYESSGWDLVSSRNGIDETLFPCFEDLLLQLQKVIESSAYDQEAKSNYRGALETRIRSLANGLNGQIFSCDEIPEEELFDKNVIIDLSRVSSTETKALIMGILVMRLNEYRISHALSMNAPLRHVTVLEEAHNILKRTSTEQSSESSNITGKAVETISNSIAEMRTYGEGFLIVDQSPNMVDISAIRNTNTKILMRLPEEKDRNDAGKSAALSDEQLRELAKLPKGVAVVYQNNWIEPVLCKIDRFPGEENTYRYDASEADRDQKKRGWFRTELMRLLLKGRMKSEFEPDLERLRGEIAGTEYPVLTKRYLYRLLEEYRRKHSLSIWERKEDLNHFVPVLLHGESESYELIENSHDMEEVRENLDLFLQREAVEDIEGLRMAVSDSIMADFSERRSEDAQIYERWREFVLEGGKLL